MKGRMCTASNVATGQKMSTIARFVDKLEKYGAMEYTTVVAATASDPAPMQFITLHRLHDGRILPR